MLTPGQAYESTYTVENLDGPPGAAALAVTLPDGTTADPPPAVGAPVASGRDYTYAVDYTPATAGLYGFTWSTTAPDTSRPTDWVNVTAYRSILSLADAREFLDLRDTARDEVLLGTLAGITALIERHVGTCVIKQVTGEHVPGSDRDMIRLAEGPLPDSKSVTSIASEWPGGPTWGPDDLIVNPSKGTCHPKNYRGFWWGPWTATYTAGRLVIPADIVEGAKAALYDLWGVQRGVEADLIEPSMEEVAAYETGVPPGWRLPPRVMQFLDGEKMLTGFA